MYWWMKVRMELEARRMSFEGLADRIEKQTGERFPVRTLRRWVMRPPNADPREGPRGECFMVGNIAAALDWPDWWALSPRTVWPAPPQLLEMWDAIRALPPELSESVANDAFQVAADHCRGVMRDREGRE